MKYLLYLTFMFMLMGGHPATACTGQTPCELGERSYHVRVPDQWDGKSELPLLLHFHGVGRQGDLIVRHGRIATGAVAQNVLLIAPNGLNRTWSFREPSSPDSVFALEILDDVAKRYPIDKDRIFVSGFSWGSNMAWRFACDYGDKFTALLGVAGTLSQQENCTVAPKVVRQVYGLDDKALRFPMGPGMDTSYPVALWRRVMGCGEGELEGAWNARPFLTFERTVWDCPNGRVSMDVHPEGHLLPHDWIPLQVEDIL